jgi:SET domain-containing protein
MKSTRKSISSTPYESFIRVKHSKVHGQGVFSSRKIPAGTPIIEYEGKRITDKQADKRFGLDPENPHHTFFFSLESGKLIDGGDKGNDARWINHACDPNCEAKEEKGRVFIHALNDIRRGEELCYDYGLIIDAKYTKKLKAEYPCWCGAPNCRGTLLAPKDKDEKKKAKKKSSKKSKKLKSKKH